MMSPSNPERLDRSTSIKLQKNLELIYNTAKDEGNLRYLVIN